MSIDCKLKLRRQDFAMDVECELPSTGITALFGPSGCGKTTLLRAIAGLDQHQGSLIVNGRVWQDENTFLPPHQRQIGYVFQESSLFSHLTVQGNLDYGRKRSPNGDVDLLQQAIDLLDLSILLHRKTSTLSGGERQRVAIARALAVNPQLLLMDEPLASLDYQRKQEILPYLESLHETLTIPMLYISHAINEVARLADYIVLIESGRVAASGDAQAIFSRLDLPLAHEHDAMSIIEAKVLREDKEFNLSYLKFIGGEIVVTGKNIQVGTEVRVAIAARDVSLTLEKQQNTSILNIFAAEVDELTDDQHGTVLVRLLMGQVPVLARITKKSAMDLNLTPGLEVFVQAKSVALLE